MLTERNPLWLPPGAMSTPGDTTASLQQLARIATRGVPGCAATTIVTWAAGEVNQAAASHPDLGMLLELQCDQSEGPELRAQLTRERVIILDTLREWRWPRYARAAVRAGVRSVMVLPVAVGDLTVTFALQAARPRSWSEHDTYTLTSLLATQVAAVLGR